MKFGRLTVLERSDDRIVPSGRREPMWKCVCECGHAATVSGLHLRSGHTQSCGCMKRESLSATAYRHGGTGTRLYGIWSGLRNRCNNPNRRRYNDWGGRGIKVCDEWNDFLNFKEWALLSGYSENLTIDRINNDMDYSPSNCRWATRSEQMRNTRYNVNYTYNGKTLCLLEWCEVAGVKYGCARSRLRRGICFEDALCLHT